jgi:hypothetical protein
MGRINSPATANLDLRRDRVWSRLWLSTVADKRSYQNTLALFRNVSGQMNLEQIPRVVTDGFGFYEQVVKRVFGPACLYG